MERKRFERDSVTSLFDNDLRQSQGSADAECGAAAAQTGVYPPDLTVVIDAWPDLSESDRKRVLAIIREASRVAKSETLPKPEYSPHCGGVCSPFLGESTMRFRVDMCQRDTFH